jgi:hypothetical protein
MARRCLTATAIWCTQLKNAQSKVRWRNCVHTLLSLCVMVFAAVAVLVRFRPVPGTPQLWNTLFGKPLCDERIPFPL